MLALHAVPGPVVMRRAEISLERAFGMEFPWPSGFSSSLHRPNSVFYPGHQYKFGEEVRIEPKAFPNCDDPDARFDFRIAPDLPSGLSLNSSNGIIEGKATQELKTTEYVVTALYMGADCCALVQNCAIALCSQLLSDRPTTRAPIFGCFELEAV